MHLEKLIILIYSYFLHMKKILNNLKLWVAILAVVSVVSWSAWLLANAADGDTYLDYLACTAGNAAVEDPYDIDFGTFDSSSVYGQSKINTGATVTGGATHHVSNIPSVATPALYLVVDDQCGDTDWHADILASSMADQNVNNSGTATAIPATNVRLQNNGTVYFLETTPNISEVTASTYGSDTPMDSAVQLLERDFAGNEVPGLFWVKPTYNLLIPAYQQPDRYEGTITWTVI